MLELLAGVPDPLSFAEQWDSFTIGGRRSPGLISEWDAGRANEWDVKKGKGAKGATLTYTGETPAEPKFTLQFWLPRHFAEWSVFRALLAYDPSKKGITALDIYHPALADLEITSVVVKSIGAIRKAGPTLWEVALEFIQYKPPLKSAVGTPTTSKSTGKGSGAGGANGSTGDPADPIADAQLAEIRTLHAKAKEP